MSDVAHGRETRRWTRPLPVRSNAPREYAGVAALTLALALGCSEPDFEPIALVPAPEQIEVRQRPLPQLVRDAPRPPRAIERVAPTPVVRAVPVAPVPDPEVIAREREEAARREFDREYPQHGVAYHFLAQVYQRANIESPVIGYMRRGAQFRARNAVSGPGCSRGWYEVSGRGFICRGEGYQLGSSPQTFSPSPMQPAGNGALPYAYAWVTRAHVPQYWHLPTPEEEALTRAYLDRVQAAEERLAEASAVTLAPASEEPSEATEASTAEEAAEPVPDLEAPPDLTEEVMEEEPTVAALDGGVAAPADERPSVLRMRMQQGFYVSIDRLETDGNRRFYRTIRGAYVPADAVTEGEPPRMRGVVLGGRWRLPLAFVFRDGVRTLRRNTTSGALTMSSAIERNTPFPLTDEVLRRRGQDYRISDHGEILRSDAIRVVQEIEIPSGIRADSRWVHVDLSQQTLTAYEGDRPVFATLIASGRDGYETPIGTFQIQSKHISTTMDDPEAGAESYSIEDVPWAMYFEGSYALHGAFWHDRFGRRRSHGCVNLAPVDARWVFEWSLPELPDGFHGETANPRAPRTFVHITQ